MNINILHFCGPKAIISISALKIHAIIYSWFLDFTPINFTYKLKQTLNSCQEFAGTNQQFWKDPLCALNLVNLLRQWVQSSLLSKQVTNIERTQVYLFQWN